MMTCRVWGSCSLATTTTTTVGRAIRRLEQLGPAKIVHRGGLGRGPSRYRVWLLTKVS
jgi:hypothetical protein